jgi:hypothetical protein
MNKFSKTFRQTEDPYYTAWSTDVIDPLKQQDAKNRQFFT